MFICQNQRTEDKKFPTISSDFYFYTLSIWVLVETLESYYDDCNNNYIFLVNLLGVLEAKSFIPALQTWGISLRLNKINYSYSRIKRKTAQASKTTSIELGFLFQASFKPISIMIFILSPVCRWHRRAFIDCYIKVDKMMHYSVNCHMQGKETVPFFFFWNLTSRYFFIS